MQIIYTIYSIVMANDGLSAVVNMRSNADSSGASFTITGAALQTTHVGQQIQVDITFL